MNDDSNEYLLITSIISGEKHNLEKLPSYSCGLYQTIIRPIKSYAVMNQKFYDLKTFMIWYECLGHPGLSMMHQQFFKASLEEPEDSDAQLLQLCCLLTRQINY